MAHVGQELALGAVGRFRRVFCRAKFDFDLAAQFDLPGKIAIGRFSPFVGGPQFHFDNGALLNLMSQLQVRLGQFLGALSHPLLKEAGIRQQILPHLRERCGHAIELPREIADLIGRIFREPNVEFAAPKSRNATLEQDDGPADLIPKRHSHADRNEQGDQADAENPGAERAGRGDRFLAVHVKNEPQFQVGHPVVDDDFRNPVEIESIISGANRTALALAALINRAGVQALLQNDVFAQKTGLRDGEPVGIDQESVIGAMVIAPAQDDVAQRLQIHPGNQHRNRQAVSPDDRRVK